jgi:hypothetical protein
MLACSFLSKGTFDPNYLFIYDFLMELLVQPRVLESWSGYKFWNLLVVKENHLCFKMMNMKWDEGSI